MIRIFSALAIAVGSLLIAAPAGAAMVPNGTVSSVATFNPNVITGATASSGTYFAPSTGGSTFQISGTGGFASVGGTTGALSGTLTFSTTVGTTVGETLSNFFVFSDGQGGTFNFSVASVMTQTYANIPNVATSGTLYVLGTTIDTNLNLTTPTPTSLSVQFNSTGASSFSSSLTLSIPPSVVPEPASIALMGLGLAGLTVVHRVRRKV